MQINKEDASSLDALFHTLHLMKDGKSAGDDRHFKIRQILSFLEIMDAELSKRSRKRTLVLLDSGAGNCYLSFLAYHYYNVLEKRPVIIHCVDRNERLMNNARSCAEGLGYTGMRFHACDILDFHFGGPVDLSYSLHACDTATDKALFLGLKLGAAGILSVSCCQHSLSRDFRGREMKGLTRFRSFNKRMLYMVADSMRAHLLEMEGYRVDLFDFTSSRNTDKNTMLRARKSGSRRNPSLEEEYNYLAENFNIRPALEILLREKEETLRSRA